MAFTHRLPLTFVLVAAASLALFLLGWRAVARLIARCAARLHDCRTVAPCPSVKS